MQWINVVLIITLNIAVIVTVLRRPKKSRLYFLLMNMAIADLMTGLTDALANAIERSVGLQYFNYMWLADDTLCYIFQKSLIGACWVLSSAVNSPHFFFYERKIKESRISTELIRCLPTDDVYKHYYKETVNMLFLFYVGLPLLVIIVSFAVLIYAIYQRARTTPNSMVQGMNPLNIPMIFNRGIPSAKARSIKLTFGIVLSFVLSWTPYMVALYRGAYGFNDGPIRRLFETAYYWNSVANPIVFFVFHKRSVTPYSSNSYMVTNNASISLDSRKTPERILEDAAAVPTSMT